MGFDLTDVLLRQMFSSLDPHKKGYITLSDWNSQFAKFQWVEQMIEEIKV